MKTRNILELVNTFEDALSLADEKTRQEYLKSVEGYNTVDEIAYKKLKLITKVINEGWEADYRNWSQKKWYLWFASLSNGAAAGLCCAHCRSASSDSSVYIGSRLNFETREKAIHVGEKFFDLWTDYLLR